MRGKSQAHSRHIVGHLVVVDVAGRYAGAHVYFAIWPTFGPAAAIENLADSLALKSPAVPRIRRF